MALQFRQFILGITLSVTVLHVSLVHAAGPKLAPLESSTHARRVELPTHSKIGGKLSAATRWGKRVGLGAVVTATLAATLISGIRSSGLDQIIAANTTDAAWLGFSKYTERHYSWFGRLAHSTIETDITSLANDPGLKPQRTAVPGQEVHSAHDTNTYLDLRKALKSNVQFVEGDVTVVGNHVVMRHNPRDSIDMTFREWLKTTSTAGFQQILIDIKHNEVDRIIEETRYGIDHDGVNPNSIIIGGKVLHGPTSFNQLSFKNQVYQRAWLEYQRAAMQLDLADLAKIGRELPGVTIQISDLNYSSDQKTHYTSDDTRQYEDTIHSLREQIGRGDETPIIVSARLDFLTPGFVWRITSIPNVTLRIYNQPTQVPPPANTEVLTDRLRRLGVNGPIEIRQ